MGFISTGNYLWNSGMFFWTLRAFYDALRAVDPTAAQVIDQVVVSLENGDEDEAKYMFGQLGSNSIDYALMERAPNVAVVAAQFEWDDLGSWDALTRSLPNDERGNVSQGSARVVDSDRCVVYNDSQALRVSVLGVEDIVVAVTDGEVMVCKKDRAQDVRALAD
jgi:mannose-1-phosphate guanylyltransferase